MGRKSAEQYMGGEKAERVDFFLTADTAVASSGDVSTPNIYYTEFFCLSMRVRSIILLDIYREIV